LRIFEELLLIFLGAGASTIYDLKTLQGLTRDLINKMNSAGHGDIIKEIRMALKYFGLTPDFENLYTIIEALQNFKQGVKNSGPLASYIAYKCRNSVSIKSHPDFKEILRDFRRIIFEECSISPEKIENQHAIYDELFHLTDVISESRILSSTIGETGKNIGIPASRTIVTTNYDMSIELHFANASIQIADGFSILGDQYIKHFDPKNFLKHGNQSNWLIKLHGSIWQFLYKNQFCKSLLDPELLPHRRLKIKERMMIYPIGEKPILKEPYYTFFKIFKEQPWQVLVAIGHSFRDLPVNIAIVENLRRVSQSILIIVNKEPEKAFNNLGIQDSIAQKVIRVNGLFGEKETFRKLRIALQSRSFKQYQGRI
jgi:hypothetical protein